MPMEIGVVLVDMSIKFVNSLVTYEAQNKTKKMLNLGKRISGVVEGCLDTPGGSTKLIQSIEDCSCDVIRARLSRLLIYNPKAMQTCGDYPVTANRRIRSSTIFGGRRCSGGCVVSDPRSALLEGFLTP